MIYLHLEFCWREKLETEAMGQSKYDYSDAVPVRDREVAPRRPRSEISAKALAREGYPVASLRPPPGTKLENVANMPFHNFEPAPELLKSPVHNFGGRILKLLKLKKKSSSATSTHFLPMEEFQPAMQTFHFHDLITHSTQFPTPKVEDARKRYNYDSEEHSDNYVSDSNTCSSSIGSSSRTSTSSAQSFDSNRSTGTQRSSFLSSGQLSNTQIMANILMSIMDEHSSTREELGSSEDEHLASRIGPHESAILHQPRHRICEDSPSVLARRPSSKLRGPHESAWHEPRYEYFVDSPLARGRRSTASKQSSGRNTPNARGRSSVDGRLTSPRPSHRFEKLDLSRIEVSKVR